MGAQRLVRLLIGGDARHLVLDGNQFKIEPTGQTSGTFRVQRVDFLELLGVNNYRAVLSLDLDPARSTVRLSGTTARLTLRPSTLAADPGLGLKLTFGLDAVAGASAYVADFEIEPRAAWPREPRATFFVHELHDALYAGAVTTEVGLNATAGVGEIPPAANALLADDDRPRVNWNPGTGTADRDVGFAVYPGDKQRGGPFAFVLFHHGRVMGDQVKLRLDPEVGDWLAVRLERGTDLRLLEAFLPEPDAVGPAVAGTRLVAVEMLPTEQVMAAWNERLVTPFRRHLTTLRGDRPLSFLPTLQSRGTGLPLWTALVHLRRTAETEHHGLCRLQPGGLRFALDPTAGPATYVAPATLRFEAVGRLDDMPLAWPAELRWSESRLVDRERLEARLGLRPALPVVSLAGPRALAAIELEIHLSPGAPAADQVVRLGAFDLTFPAAGQSAETGQLELWLPSADGGLERAALAFELNLTLPLDGFAPGSQDVPEIEGIEEDRRRPQPLLVPLNAFGPEEGRSLSLSVREAALPEKLQRLKLEILALETAVAGGSVIVLDTDPFLIARVTMPDLVPTDETGLIAAWDSDGVEGAAWVVQAQRQGYQMLLPPQAVGEAAVKQKVGAPAPEIADGEPADFRFSPPAALKLFTTWRREDRGYVEPPTNTRRIFGDASQRAPGAPLRDAALELLYGLTARIEAREQVLLLTELTADLGLLPARLATDLPRWDLKLEPGSTDRKAIKDDLADGKVDEWRHEPFPFYRCYLGNWSALHDAFAKRLGVLTLHPAGRSEGAALSDGVTFELRRGAEIRRPVPPPADPGDLRSPYPPTGERDPVDGLPGGVDWGFESTNVYESVWRKSTSDGGEVSGLHLSPLGGWGYQRALFDNRRTTVISRTGMGRAHFYSLERVGRIGCLWNRAKHVIVYERTVLPSVQFGTEPDPSGPGKVKLGQPTHAGRPILRKVREFVEILEPERRYPEDGRSLRQCGPARVGRFRSTLIPVDSAWGEDVFEPEGGRQVPVGWKVPLWNPAAGAANPGAYPKPQVELGCARDPESGTDIVFTTFEAPQELVFFASVREAEDDRTDEWRSTLGVDCVDLPQPLPPPVPYLAASDPDASLPAPAPVEPGFAPVTFTLGTVVEQGANLVAGRAEARAVSAVLKNVTLMRAAPVAVVGEHAQVARAILNLPGELDRLADSLRAELATVAGKEVKQVKQQVTATVEGLAKNARELLEKELKRLFKGTGELQDVYKNILKDGPCTLLKKQAEAAIDRLKERAGDELERLAGDLLADIEGKLDPDVAKAKRQLVELIGPVFVRLSFLVTTAGNLLESFDSRLQPLRALDLRGALAAALDRFKKEARQATASGRSEILAALRGLKASALAEVDGVLDGIIASLGARLPKVAGEIAAKKQAAHDALAKKFEAQILDVEEKLAAGAQNIDELIGKALDAIKAAADLGLKAIQDTITELPQQQLVVPLKAVGDALKKAQKDIAETQRQLEAAIESAGSGEVEKAKQAIRDAFAVEPPGPVMRQVREGLDAVKAAVGGALSDPQGPCAALLGGDDFWTGTLGKAKEVVDQLEARLKSLLADDDTVGRALDKLEAEARRLGGDLGVFGDHLAAGVRGQLGEVLGQAGSSILGLVRAFGEAPKVPGLDFNRPDLAYYFDLAGAAAKEAGGVLTTPVAALVDRAGNELKALGIRLPTGEIAERFIPKLDGLDLSKLFPDFAGIRLDKLLPDLKVPAAAKDKVRVTHGADKESRRGWVEANVDRLPVGDRSELFDLGPIAVGLAKGAFSARTRLEAGLDGRVERQASGRIDGDWELGFGGQTLVVFRDTPLTYDDASGLRFDLRPEKVELASAVRFLDRFVKQLGGDVGGLRLGALKDESGLPVGFEALLDLQLPPLTYGTFGVSGMRLATGVQLRAYPTFEIRAFFALGSRREPFTITVFILGGAGWIEGAARYVPATGELGVDVSVAIGASAALGFNFGPVRGGVQLFFGLNAELHTNARGGARLDLVIVLMASGCVRVANLISVGLHLRLEVRIEEGKRVIGHGEVTYEVKLGFLKKSFSAQVTYRFAGSAGGEARRGVALPAGDGARFVAAPPDYGALARAYLDTLA